MDEFIRRSEMNAGRQTVLDTSGFVSLFGAMGAKIAEVRRKWDIINDHPVHGFQNMLGNRDPVFPGRIGMLLLTGYLA